MSKDAINPDHYRSDPSGVECIQITRHRNFNVGNAIKYLWRLGLKDGNPAKQELEKARWYLVDEMSRLEKLWKHIDRPYRPSDPSKIEAARVTRHRTVNVRNALNCLWLTGLSDGMHNISYIERAIAHIDKELEKPATF